MKARILSRCLPGSGAACAGNVRQALAGCTTLAASKQVTVCAVGLRIFIAGAALVWGGAGASAQERVMPTEHVREDYAQVLRVEPVYQVLNASTAEQRCRQTPGSLVRECREVRVPLEYRRPIAYDVEYTYRGVKYRSRLAQDPGRRLRIRIAIRPVVSEGTP